VARTMNICDNSFVVSRKLIVWVEDEMRWGVTD
jgi:hypothetical protein